MFSPAAIGPCCGNMETLPRIYVIRMIMKVVSDHLHTCPFPGKECVNEIRKDIQNLDWSNIKIVLE